jgi:uncharacterized membrane-anchored protein
MSKKALILVSIFWLVIIGSLIGLKEYTLRTGTEVLLRTVPVDPRDLFRGDYVILRYEISTINIGNTHVNWGSFKGSNIYVTLVVEDGYGSATGVSFEKPDGLFIYGKITEASEAEITLNYGIESYFVPEGAGKLIESQRGNGLDVRVSIDRFGNSLIKSLAFHDDAPAT